MSDTNVIKFDGREPVTLIKWKVKKGSNLSNGLILFTYIENGIEKKFKCDEHGNVINLLAQENQLILPGQNLIKFEICQHTTVMKDLCAECGMDLRKTGEVNYASVSMIHSVPELKVSIEQAKKLGKADEEKLLRSRKLVLLVDLDQTLIHTTNEPISIKSKEINEFRLYPGHSQTYYTKLRPYTKEFLEKVSKLFELHICTFGARMYAHKIAQILDPEGKLFSHRILSRDECFDPQLKTGNLKALFPCGDSMVCIIDDREDVWNYLPNLVTVKAYNFFKNTGDINSPSKQKDDLIASAAKELSLKKLSKEKDSLNKNNKSDLNLNEINEINEKVIDFSEKLKEEKLDEKTIISKSDNDDEEEKKNAEHCLNNEESKIEPKNEVNMEIIEKTQINVENNVEDHDDYLLYLLDILSRIHNRFYKEYSEIMKYTVEDEHVNIPDLKKIIPQIRREVLKGVNLVFSGLIPTKIPPEQSRLWAIAKSLGANVSKVIVKEGSPIERTTHLVASNLGTAKVLSAIKTKKIWIVNPLWLYVCAERWEKPEEKLFPLNKHDDYGNPQKRKGKLTADEEMFLNFDLLKFSYNSRYTKNNSLDEKKSQFSFPVYDAVTGKLIRNENDLKPSTSASSKNDFFVKETLEPHCMLELSPLSAFSDKDLLLMDKEVDDACSENDHLSSSSSEDENQDESSCSKDYFAKKRKYEDADLSEESMDNDFSKSWSKGKIRSLGDDNKNKDASFNSLDYEDDTRDTFANDENDSGSDEEMGAALERDFLS